MDDSDFAQILQDPMMTLVHKNQWIPGGFSEFPCWGELKILSKIGIYHTQHFQNLCTVALLTDEIFDPLL